MLQLDDCIVPDWPAPPGVKAIFTTRQGGVSVNTDKGELASLNLGKSVGDNPEAVNENRRRVATLVGHTPHWLGLVHGTNVACLDEADHKQNIVADACIAHHRGVVCAVTMADCLPVLFTDTTGSVVAAAHAGWRGLAAGVLEATIATMRVSPASIVAVLGQAIGPTQFEVGEDVRAAFITKSNTGNAFEPFMAGNTRKYWANIFLLARYRLQAAGVPSSQIYGGVLCTVTDSARFFSYRREGRVGKHSGRMAALIWRE
jgi:YfiH family protein